MLWGEILLSRYDLYLKTNNFQNFISSAVEKSHNCKIFKNRNLTHATINLNAQELEVRYGNRIRSRMRQLFNLIAFDKESVDKRK